jgi:hypothetical protein
MSNFVKSTIKINFPKIKQLDRATITALEETIEALKTEVINAQVMPFDTGNMQNNSTFTDIRKSKQGRVSLITSTPYARRLYYHPEYNFQTKENAHAQGNWLESWISGKNKDFVGNSFAKLYKKEAGL